MRRQGVPFGNPLTALAAGCCVALALVSGVAIVRQTRADPSPPPAVRQHAAEGRIFYPAGDLPAIVLPDGRRESVRSVLHTKARMRYGEFVWNDANVPQGAVWVLVDLRTQMLTAFRAGHEIGSAVILYGGHNKPSPVGSFRILQKAEHYVSRTYDAPMPYMLRLTADGVAIHASKVRRGAATHGCIGVPDDFARRLFGETRPGDRVEIVGL